MKTHNLLVTVLLMSWLPAFSQGDIMHSRDSLANAVTSMPDDTNKVTTYLNIVRYFLMTNPSEGIDPAQKALQLSQQLKWRVGLRASYGVLGSVYSAIGEYGQARENLDKSLQLAQEDHNTLDIGRASGALGSVLYYQGQFPDALAYYNIALKAAEDLKEPQGIAATLNNIGSVHMDQMHYERAIPYFERAMLLNKENKFWDYLMANYTNLGICRSNLKQHEEAMEYYRKALEVADQIGEEAERATVFTNMASEYSKLNDPAHALEYFKKALMMSREYTDQRGIVIAQLGIANQLRKIADSGSINEQALEFGSGESALLQNALAYVDSAIVLATEMDDLVNLSTTYECRSEILQSLNRHEDALIAFRKHAVLKDSIFNMEKEKKLTQNAMQYEFDKKEAATRAEQEKKDIRERNIRYSIGAGLAGALIFLTVVWRQRNKISKEKKRSEELLLNILPEEVAEELKQKGEADAVLIDQATVLFTDFKGFTAMSEKLSPKELVRDLHECFSAFDQIMAKYGMEKIKTIGDAYMAAGGLPTPNDTHASDAVKAAIEMRDFVEAGKQRKLDAQLPYFEIRIGIHTGPVVAGIVGVKKFQYDIWGDTVNTASRMESSGEPGKINISENTYLLVKDQYICTPRGKVHAKGKGDLAMYFVN